MGCDGWLEQDELEEIAGLRRIELPAGLTFATAQRLHRAGITPAPVTDLRYVVYPWVVDCQALREAGWQPVTTTPTALGVLLEQRPGITPWPAAGWPGRTRRSPRLARPSRSSAPRPSSARSASGAAGR